LKEKLEPHFFFQAKDGIRYSP